MTRYRFDKVSERAKLKTSVARLVTILFPELEKLVPTLHMKSVYALLSEFPSAAHVASANLKKLTNLLYSASKGRYGRDKAGQLKETAKRSIGTLMPAKALELKHTISLIEVLSEEIDEVDAEIKKIIDESGTTLTTIPGLSYATVFSIYERLSLIVVLILKFVRSVVTSLFLIPGKTNTVMIVIKKKQNKNGAIAKGTKTLYNILDSAL
jgi:hypothetical protein